MTKEELKKLQFEWVSHVSYEDEYLTTYKCVSEPFKGRLTFCNRIRRDDKTGFIIGRKRTHYMLDGKVYKSRESFLKAVKEVEA